MTTPFVFEQIFMLYQQRLYNEHIYVFGQWKQDSRFIVNSLAIFWFHIKDKLIMSSATGRFTNLKAFDNTSRFDSTYRTGISLSALPTNNRHLFNMCEAGRHQLYWM